MNIEVFKRKKTWGNILFFGALLTILLVPAAKAMVIQGLMEIGLFSPDLKQSKNLETPSLSSEIVFKDAKDRLISLNDLKGKVVFLNFWATWCPPCLAEMPSVSRLYERYKMDPEVIFLMIDADSDFKKAENFMNRKGFNMPVYTFASELPERVFDGSLPTTLVFDKQGRISFHEVGAANYNSKKFIAFMEQLKAQHK